MEREGVSFYMYYNVSNRQFVCQLSAFPVSVEIPVNVEISIIINESIVVLCWAVFHGMPRRDFATKWAAIMHAIPFDMVGTVALETSNRSRRGRWSGDRMTVSVRMSRDSS